MRARSGIAGILVVDKPAGASSNAVARRVQRLFGTRAAGYLGTLDPFATGVLPVMLEEATRLGPLLEGGAKTYVAEMTLGVETDTLDRDGVETSRGPVPDDAIGRLEAALPRFLGTIRQRVPDHSAAKVDGVRRCDLAREGRPAPPIEKEVEVHAIRVLEATPPIVRIEVSCGGGTYIRSLVSDLGGAIGCGAHCSALRRTRSGPFAFDQGVTLERIEATDAPDRPALLLDLRPLFSVPTFDADEGALGDLARGRAVPAPDPVPAGWTEDGAVLVVSDDRLRAIAVFREGLVHPKRFLGDRGIAMMPQGGFRAADRSSPYSSGSDASGSKRSG